MRNIDIKVGGSSTLDGSVNLFEPVKVDTGETVASVQLIKEAGFIDAGATLAFLQSNFDQEDTFAIMNIGGVPAEGPISDPKSTQIERLDPLASAFVGVRYTSNSSTGSYKIRVTLQKTQRQ